MGGRVSAVCPPTRMSTMTVVVAYVGPDTISTEEHDGGWGGGGSRLAKDEFVVRGSDGGVSSVDESSTSADNSGRSDSGPLPQDNVLYAELLSGYLAGEVSSSGPSTHVSGLVVYKVPKVRAGYLCQCTPNILPVVPPSQFLNRLLLSSLSSPNASFHRTLNQCRCRCPHPTSVHCVQCKGCVSTHAMCDCANTQSTPLPPPTSVCDVLG